MRDVLASVAGVFTDTTPTPCTCTTTFADDALVVDANDCDGNGVLERAPDCRATVVSSLAERDVHEIRTHADGVERTYAGRGAALLVAAGRFVERTVVHDEWLADTCRRDPLAAAREATGRAGVVARIAAETGLAECADGNDGYEAIVRPTVAPALVRGRVTDRPPTGSRLDDRRELDTGATARIYSVDGRSIRTYHLRPPELELTQEETRALDRAYTLLASGAVTGGASAPVKAVRRTLEAPDGGVDTTGAAPPAVDHASADTLATVLEKHTQGLGVLEDVFADDRVSDVYVTSPVEHTRLRVVVDGETMRSNVTLTEADAAALASRFRRESGRAFSRATPALDATVTTGAGPVRVAGLTGSATDGVAFAFRASADDPFTLPGLVANGTIPASAAGLLSVAIDRGAATLVAGPRGAGKTTTLAALLWELEPATRLVCIEDTPELPVSILQRHGRDVQRIRTARGEEAGLTPSEALHTALRLGDGALVLGEVRGEEAAVLYEAMRVGAESGAVLGTIHGDGAAAVRERVVSDLGVPETSFASTDLVVTLARDATDGGVSRRVVGIEEVVETSSGLAFEPLYSSADGELTATGRMARGESLVCESLARPSESYADVLDRVRRRSRRLRERADAGLTAPADLDGGVDGKP